MWDEPSQSYYFQDFLWATVCAPLLLSPCLSVYSLNGGDTGSQEIGQCKELHEVVNRANNQDSEEDGKNVVLVVRGRPLVEVR